MLQGPPTGIGDKLRALGKLAGVARAQPKTVSRGACQEVVVTGEDVDLDRLPIIKCWPMDAGRFITFPLVISRDPETGRRNVGTYRMQVYDGRTTGMHWQTHKVGARHYRTGERKGSKRLEVAVAIGADPTTMWTGSLPVPPDMDEIMVSGVLRGSAVEMVRCKTVDLEVPAHAEIVLEGYVRPGRAACRGAVRRPYGLLLAGRRLPGVPRDGHNPPEGAYIRDDCGGEAAVGGLLHGEGERASDAAGAPAHAA